MQNQLFQHSIPVGVLYIVATPIGNLKDITHRALEVLALVDIIACEDTRHCKKLLQHWQISKKCMAYHEHNEEEKTNELIKLLLEGKQIALVSDAGTPLIHDPGYLIVNKAHALGITVCPIPGPCALIAALQASCLPTHSFVFEGFLSSKVQARQTKLDSLTSETRTMIFYEAPHRLLDFLEGALKSFGPHRLATVAKELTKMYEKIIHGSLEQLLHQLKQEERILGEYVIIIAGVETPLADNNQTESILRILLKELSLKQAVHLAQEITHESRNSLYNLALELMKSTRK